MGVSENNIGPLPTTARPHRRDTGRTAGRRPYASGGPKCFVRYVFWGQGPFSASRAIECRLREALRLKTWCRRSRRRHSHLPRGPGKYDGHRREPWLFPSALDAVAIVAVFKAWKMAPFCTPGNGASWFIFI